MDFSSFRGIRCIGVSKDRELLAQLFLSETGAARWYRVQCNPKTHNLEFLIYSLPALSKQDTCLDLYSPTSDRMESTHIKIKRVGVDQMMLYLVCPKPDVAVGIPRHETFRCDMLGMYFCGPSQTFVHKEYREWTLSVNDQSQVILCHSSKLVGVEVAVAAPRRICETATVSEIVQLVKGRSQQFAAQTLLSLLKMKGVFGCWQHTLPSRGVGKQGGIMGDALKNLGKKPNGIMLTTEPKSGSRRKRVEFMGSIRTEFESKGLKKPKARRICDRGMRKDLADRPKWDALHLRKKDALVRLVGTCPGSFVIHRASGDVCCLTMVLPGGALHDTFIKSFRQRRKESFQLKCRSGTLQYRSLGALLEVLYKCDQTVLPIPLVRMDYEGEE